MRVLRVIANMNPASGGPCQGLRNSIPALKKLGVDNEVVSLDDPAARYLGEDAFPVHALGAGKSPWCYNARLLPWLLKHMQRFDAVIVHGLWLYHSYAVLQAIRQYREQHSPCPRFFVMPHGMLDPYFQHAPERKLKALRNRLYWRWIEEKVVHEADGLLFTCQAELELARAPFRPYQPRREINVGYGIASPPPFEPSMKEAFLQKCAGLAGKPYLLFLSRIHEKKGVDLLLQAYTSLHKEARESGRQLPKLVVAGPGMETAFGFKLQRMLQQFPHLQSEVFFPGMLRGEAKWGAFWGCEAFVLPSHQENFGIAVVEALACSKAVLISDQVNIWKEIEAEGGGMVARDTLEGVTKQLDTWLKLSVKEKEALEAGALNAFNNRFSIGPAARQLLEGVLC